LTLLLWMETSWLTHWLTTKRWRKVGKFCNL
jgi:hypothetical protein